MNWGNSQRIVHLCPGQHTLLGPWTPTTSLFVSTVEPHCHTGQLFTSISPSIPLYFTIRLHIGPLPRSTSVVQPTRTSNNFFLVSDWPTLLYGQGCSATCCFGVLLTACVDLVLILFWITKAEKLFLKIPVCEYIGPYLDDQMVPTTSAWKDENDKMSQADSECFI